MKRRDVVRFLATGSMGLGVTHNVHAEYQCTPFMPNGVQRCQVGIRSALLGFSAENTQRLDQWCWAACIQMVFRYYGYRVAQRRIVEETFGQAVNLPARADHIMNNLNRDWEDDAGAVFSVTADAYSSHVGSAADDLANDMPLIVGTMGHAMVLTSLDLFRDAYGQIQVAAAIVRDPWPGRGRRLLSPHEWNSISFAARIRVD